MSKIAAPGRWGGEEEVTRPSHSELATLVPTSYPDIIARYELVRDTLGLDPSTVYSPCCGTDTSPSVVFPGARVIYMDQSEPSVDALRRGGHEASVGGADGFNPGSVDLCVLLNPQVPAIRLVPNLKSGGHVLCNNFHGTADQLRSNPEFELLGFVQSGKDGYAFVRFDLNAQQEQLRTAVDHVDSDLLKEGQSVPQNKPDDIYVFRKE